MQSNSKSPSPVVRLGPIIGKVTNTTARVAIEIEHNNEVTCILTSLSGKQFTCRRLPEKGFPTIFKFSGLDPKTLYQVSLEKVKLPRGSQFKTLRNNDDEPGKLNVAFVSCNETNKAEAKPPNRDLWADLAKRVSELDYVFHIGDQCYMDMGEEVPEKTPYQICADKLNKTPQEDWAGLTDEILEILRAHYRRTWSVQGTAAVLANVPNLMLLDDHEVRDDWGWRPEDWDPVTKKCDYFFGTCARRVYYEYQRQLRDDINWSKLTDVKCEYYDEIFNGVGIALLDYRGSRSWCREDFTKYKQLGAKQAAWVNGLFAPGGKFKDVTSVLFVSPIPMLFFSHILTDKIVDLKKQFDDLKEHWSYNHIDELKELLGLLKKWKKAKCGREITLIGGDVHVGGHTDLYYKDEGVFKQFTTSAINNEVPKKYQFEIMQFFQKMFGDLGKGLSYEHYDWVRFNNYGLVSVHCSNGESFVTCQLVISEETGIKVQEPHTNKVWRKETTKCCTCNTF